MKTKKIIISILCASGFLSAGNIVTAQDTIAKTTTYEVKDENKEEPKLRPMELGFHVLPMFTALKFQTYNGETVQGTATMGWGYGGVIATHFSKNIGLQGEINYNPISQKYKDRGLERTVAVNYLDIPVLLSINTDKTCPVNFNIVLGPQFGVNLGSSVKSAGSNSETDTLSAVVGARAGDVGAAYGAGFEFFIGKDRVVVLETGFRGMYGLVDMRAKSIGNDSYNVLVSGARKSYGAYAGVRFAF